MENSKDEIFKPEDLISSYSRAQAIEDGVLVDLMQDKMLGVCQSHYQHPIACTAAVFSIMERAVANKRQCNDFAGILHDMLWMSKIFFNYRKIEGPYPTKIFRVKITGAGRKSLYNFKMVCVPGDQAEPVITIMLPEED